MSGFSRTSNRLPRRTRPYLACKRDDPARTEPPSRPRTDQWTGGHRRQPVVELEPQRAGAVPPARPGAVAPHPAQSHRAVATGRSRATRRVRSGPGVPEPVRRRRGRGRARRHVRRHMVRHLVSRVRQSADRVLLRRVRAARLGSHLLGGSGSPRRPHAGRADLRLRQEWILGVGGVRVLRPLGYDPPVWHSNEGHAAFMLVERVRELVARGTAFAEAVRKVRATSVFTTHTPVPAGHDTFSIEQVEQCVGPVWQEMGIGRDVFVRLGHHPGVDHDRFHMPVAAIRLSARVNAVSRRHGEESRRIWAPLWPDRDVARVPIGQVTTGVHIATWMANRILTLFDSHFGTDWLARVDDPKFWDKVLELDATALWAVHNQLKAQLMRSI